MMSLSVKQRQYLKGLAHDLKPVVMIGDKGLTVEVLKEVNNTFNSHELIKIKVLNDSREFRTGIIEELCQKTNAKFVQHLGKILVLYRENSDKKVISLPVKK